jgi:sorting nexin-9/18/33
MSKYQRLFSYSLLSLITSMPLASAPQQPNGLTHEDEEEEEDTSRKGLLNADGAWCWRENCEGRLHSMVRRMTVGDDDCHRLLKADKGTAKDG